jgi:hypothetical protein
MKVSNLLSCLTIGCIILINVPAHAWWKTTKVVGPGVTVEQEHTWWGGTRQKYNDALGNHYTHQKSGWFGLGKERTDASVMGSHVKQVGNNVEATGPNGKPMLVKKRTWYGRETTVIDANSILNNGKHLFQP